MLIIKLGDRETHFETRIWHVGDPFPECRLYPCVSFQADGHELQMILEAMRTAIVIGSRVYVSPEVDAKSCAQTNDETTK